MNAASPRRPGTRRQREAETTTHQTDKRARTTHKQEHVRLGQIIAWNTLYGTENTHAQHNATTREGSRIADMNTDKNSVKESRTGDRNIVESNTATREESRLVDMDIVGSSTSTREESRLVGMDTSSDNTISTARNIGPQRKQKRKRKQKSGNQKQMYRRKQEHGHAKAEAHGEETEASSPNARRD